MFTFNDFGINVEESTLSNGVPVLLLQKKGMPVHIGVRFASGSRFDPVDKEGLSHFVEHMIVAGSKKFPSKDKMAIYIEQLGGIFGASTSSDAMSIKLEVAGKEDFKEGVLLLREMLTESLFDEKTIETERKSIFNEIKDKISNPSRYIWDLYSELFFQETEVGKSTLGSKDSVGSITREDLLDFYESMLVSGRSVIVISGDISFDQVISELERGLPLRISDKYSFKNTIPVVREKKVTVRNYPKQDQIHLVLGFRTVGLKDSDTIPLAVLSTIFGGGRASVFSKRLRYEKGLVYGSGTHSYRFSNGGAWVVKTSTSKDKIQEVVDIITEEFTRIASGGVTKEELEFAKDKITKSSRRQMQTSASWVSRHIFNELVKNPVRLPDYLNTVVSTTRSDLSRVGKKYFKPGMWYLALCGDVDENIVKVNY